MAVVDTAMVVADAAQVVVEGAHLRKEVQRRNCIVAADYCNKTLLPK